MYVPAVTQSGLNANDSYSSQFLEFSAINIKRLIITTSLKRFPAGAPFFAAMPTLEQLTLTSLSEEPYADSRLPEFFSTAATIQETQITTSALHELTLSGQSTWSWTDEGAKLIFRQRRNIFDG